MGGVWATGPPPSTPGCVIREVIKLGYDDFEGVVKPVVLDFITT